jgi:hypothetical protein
MSGAEAMIVSPTEKISSQVAGAETPASDNTSVR